MTLSLRRFHEVFVLAAIVMAEMFGAWAIHHFVETHDAVILGLGLFTLVGGLALSAYVLFFEREMGGSRVPSE